MADRTDNIFYDDADFQLSVVHYLEGQLKPIELARFNQLLREDLSARSAFVQICLTRAGLIEQLKENAEYDLSRQQAVQFPLDESDAADLNETMVAPAFVPPTEEPAEEEPEFKPAPYVPATKQEQKAPRRAWQFAAGILLLLTLGGITWIQHRSGPPPRNSLASTDGNNSTGDPQTQLPVPTVAQNILEKDLGVLDEAIDAVWAAGPDTGLTTSAKLAPGPHDLLHGVVKVSFKDGTSLVIQGPAQFEIGSDSRVHLSLGRLCAKVPHTGADLTVTGGGMTAVDLGTEFGMEVKPNDQTHLEVFDGHVRGEVTNSAGQTTTKLLSANEAAVTVAGTGAIQTATATPLAFVRDGEMEQLEKSSDSPFKRWLSFSQTLRQDPDLVAYYPFDNRSEKPDKLLNRSMATASLHDGVLGNDSATTEIPHWSQGRWAGKDALSFGDDGSSAVTFNQPADLIPPSAITLGFWLKRTENTKAIHFLNGTIDLETRFNLNLLGTLGKPSQRLNANSAYLTWSLKDVSSTAALPSDGRWYLLMVTADLSGPTNFYVNGNLISSVPGTGTAAPALEKLTLGAPVDGNLGADHRDIFRGSIDEMMIFRRVLSADEIQRIYNAGGSY